MCGVVCGVVGWGRILSPRDCATNRDFRWKPTNAADSEQTQREYQNCERHLTNHDASSILCKEFYNRANIRTI